MNRFRLLALATVLMLAMTTFAQQPANSGQQQHNATPSTTVEGHLRALSQSLNLTVDQQDKLRPILQGMFDGQQRIMADAGLSDEQRREQMKALHEKADKQARQYLNDDQKKKLDELEAQHEHHG